MAYKKEKVTVYKCKCERCLHQWISIKGLPKSCPGCKSKMWNENIKCTICHKAVRGSEVMVYRAKGEKKKNNGFYVCMKCESSMNN